MPFIFLLLFKNLVLQFVCSIEAYRFINILHLCLSAINYSTIFPTLLNYLHSPIAQINKKHLKNVGPIRYCEPPLHCQSPGVASRTPAIATAQAACDATTTTTTTTTRDRGDRYGPMEWAQLVKNNLNKINILLLCYFLDTPTNKDRRE